MLCIELVYWVIYDSVYVCICSVFLLLVCYCKNETGINSLPTPKGFVEHEKKAAVEVKRLMDSLPDFDAPQTDDGYDY